MFRILQHQNVRNAILQKGKKNSDRSDTTKTSKNTEHIFNTIIILVCKEKSSQVKWMRSRAEALDCDNENAKNARSERELQNANWWNYCRCRRTAICECRIAKMPNAANRLRLCEEERIERNAN